MSSTTTCPTQTPLYVKWRKTITLPGPAKTVERADHYVVVVQPSSPIQVGSRVRLELLSNSSFHSPKRAHPPIEYDAYNLFVEGVIERVAATVGGETTMVMKNANTWNAIRYAYITTPNIHENLSHIEPRQASGQPRQNATTMSKITWLEPNSRVTTQAPPAQALTSPFFDFQLTDTEIMEGQESGVGTLVTSLRKRTGFHPTGTFGPTGAFYCGKMTCV